MQIVIYNNIIQEINKIMSRKIFNKIKIIKVKENFSQKILKIIIGPNKMNLCLFNLKNY